MSQESSKLARIRLLAMDVDGVLTDGTIAFDSSGGQSKRFQVADGLGLVVLRQAGILIAWVSGRADAVVVRRAEELQIAHLLQGVRDKGAALEQLRTDLGLARDEIAYIGDDWNDLLAFDAVGTRIAVANAVEEVKAQADLVTQARGGEGAVREVCDALLEARGIREASLKTYLESLRGSGESRLSGQ
jgi:3-deoxy-D-manno-octulosonate 8-phosphate phosphatase (KDO 8-P phosphatase)